MLNLSDRTLLFTILALVAISVLMQVFVKKEDDASFSISLPKINLPGKSNSNETY